jgi:hypothetical protein
MPISWRALSRAGFTKHATKIQMNNIDAWHCTGRGSPPGGKAQNIAHVSNRRPGIPILSIACTNELCTPLDRSSMSLAFEIVVGFGMKVKSGWPGNL